MPDYPKYSAVRESLDKFQEACIAYGSSLGSFVSIREMDDCSIGMSEAKLKFIEILDKIYVSSPCKD